MSEEVLVLLTESNRALQQELSQGTALSHRPPPNQYFAKALLLQSQLDYSQAYGFSATQQGLYNSQIRECEICLSFDLGSPRRDIWRPSFACRHPLISLTI